MFKSISFFIVILSIVSISIGCIGDTMQPLKYAVTEGSGQIKIKITHRKDDMLNDAIIQFDENSNSVQLLYQGTTQIIPISKDFGVEDIDIELFSFDGKPMPARPILGERMERIKEIIITIDTDE